MVLLFFIRKIKLIGFIFVLLWWGFDFVFGKYGFVLLVDWGRRCEFDEGIVIVKKGCVNFNSKK